MDAGDPVFLLDRDGEAAGTFSRHNPKRREGVFSVTTNKQRRTNACNFAVFSISVNSLIYTTLILTLTSLLYKNIARM